MLLMSDKNWIQKATKNMRKDKPCTGEKFGSETCPPGSKRYNLAKTFRKMAKEGHKLASLEKASVLSASDDPSDQDKAREIRTRHDYESLKRQIGSKKRPTKPAVNEGDVHSGQGEKIQKRTKAWMSKQKPPIKGAPGLDAMKARTAEHKAKRGVKEEVVTEEDPRLAIYQSGMTDASRVKGPVGKAVDKVKDKVKKVLGKKDKVSSHLDRYRFQSGLDNYLKSKVKKEEVELDERLGGKGYQPYTSLTGKKVSGDWEDSDRGAGNKAKRRAGGKVKVKSPTYLAHVHNKKIDETVAGGVPLTPQELEIQKKMSKLNVRLARKRNQQMQKAKVDDTESSPEQVKEEDKAFKYVVDKLRKQHGKDAVITKTSKPKPASAAQKAKVAAERKKRQEADNKAFADRAKKAGYKNPQDYANVVARYGSEDNYRKGKGLGT